jgi:hypothetical protein
LVSIVKGIIIKNYFTDKEMFLSKKYWNRKSIHFLLEPTFSGGLTPFLSHKLLANIFIVAVAVYPVVLAIEED